MRVWIDLTNSPHVLVMRPLIEILQGDGHEVSVTARDFAQTLELCERFGIAHTAIGRHRGGNLAAKAGGLLSRSYELVRFARASRRASGGRGFDIALGHGSNDVSVAAALLRIPSATAFDYEWATVQHNVNCRLASAVVVPEAIPPERLARYGARAAKLRRYEGLKEEYYLADFEPQAGVLEELALDRERPLVVVRTPPEVSLYHRFENDVFAAVLRRLAQATAEGVQAVVLPRVPEQRGELAAVEGFTVPVRAIDAQSLIAFADLVISAGGTMNREAVALGTPALTTFAGRPGAVDERLVAEGRLGVLADAERLELSTSALLQGRRARAAAGGRVRRDPRELLGLMLSALDGS
jgi:predicted glycosyltransferase